jgi:hypothetical protein
MLGSSGREDRAVLGFEILHLQGNGQASKRTIIFNEKIRRK